MSNITPFPPKIKKDTNTTDVSIKEDSDAVSTDDALDYILPPAIFPPAILPPAGSSLYCYALYINKAYRNWRKITGSTLVELCRRLVDVKKTLSRKDFNIVTSRLDFEASKARKWTAIGENEVICANLHKLPLGGWNTSYELAKLKTPKEQDFLQEKFDDGSIHPKLLLKDARKIRREGQGKPVDDQTVGGNEQKPKLSFADLVAKLKEYYEENGFDRTSKALPEPFLEEMRCRNAHQRSLERPSDFEKTLAKQLLRVQETAEDKSKTSDNIAAEVKRFIKMRKAAATDAHDIGIRDLSQSSAKRAA